MFDSGDQSWKDVDTKYIIEKIDYITANEGAELADAYRALKTFLRYGCSDDMVKFLLYHLREEIEDIVDDIKAEESDEDTSLDNIFIATNILKSLGLKVSHDNLQKVLNTLNN